MYIGNKTEKPTTASKQTHEHAFQFNLLFNIEKKKLYFNFKRKRKKCGIFY